MELTDQLALGVPISCEDLGTIYQPVLKDLVKYGDYVGLFYPFMISKGLISKELEEDAQYKDFDLFFLIQEDGQLMLKGQTTEALIGDMVIALAFFYKTEDVRLIFEEQVIVINDEIVIDRDNYNKLADIILATGSKERLQKEEEKHYKSKRLKALHEKLERNRADVRRRNAILMSDMINILSVNTIRGFTFEEIRDMTIWQINTAYRNIMQVDRHELMMRYKVSEKFTLEDEVEHWSKTNKMQKIEI